MKKKKKLCSLSKVWSDTEKDVYLMFGQVIVICKDHTQQMTKYTLFDLDCWSFTCMILMVQKNLCYCCSSFFILGLILIFLCFIFIIIN